MTESKVEFIDTSKECYKEMVNLSKKALKAGGKVVTKILKENIPAKTGNLKKSVTAWAKVNRNTGTPYLDIGYRSRAQMKKKYGIKFFVNPTWFEFGVKPHTIMTKEFSKLGKSSYQLTNASTGAQFGVIVKHPGMSSKNFLRNTVYDHIDEIKNAQEDYLKELTDMMIVSGANISINEEDEEVD